MLNKKQAPIDPDHGFTPFGEQDLPDARVGVLMANLGTPEGTGYWPMRRYLSEFLSDKRVVDLPRLFWQPLLQLVILSKRPFSSGRAYRSIWNNDAGESPLMTITKDQRAKLATMLAARYGDRVVVDFAMRYGAPSIADKLATLAAAGCDRVVFLPLYPQYAGATVGSANDGLFNALTRMKWQPALRVVQPYFDHPAYISALAQSIRDGFAAMARAPDMLVVSFHGLPERYITEGDPYYIHCRTTTRLLQAELGLPDDQVTMTFQSKFGREEWIKPATVDAVADLARAGKTDIAVVAPGFAADCIETLEEINQEIKDSFIEAGGKTFTYIPCLNDRDDHIAALGSILEAELKGWSD